MAIYEVKPGVTITTGTSPLTVLYSSLTDKDGNALPSEFSEAPSIITLGSIGDRNVIISSVTTTGFVMTLSALTGNISVTSFTVKLIITGDS
tara:strand:+ start:1513 stop:1788 length:276 start_codon:yes stop_codon:yes gene_type:complete